MLVTQPAPSGCKENVCQEHGEVEVYFGVIRRRELAIELVLEQNCPIIFRVEWNVGRILSSTHGIGGYGGQRDNGYRDGVCGRERNRNRKVTYQRSNTRSFVHCTAWFLGTIIYQTG